MELSTQSTSSMILKAEHDLYFYKSRVWLVVCLQTQQESLRIHYVAMTWAFIYCYKSMLLISLCFAYDNLFPSPLGERYHVWWSFKRGFSYDTVTVTLLVKQRFFESWGTDCAFKVAACSWACLCLPCMQLGSLCEWQREDNRLSFSEWWKLASHCRHMDVHGRGMEGVHRWKTVRWRQRALCWVKNPWYASFILYHICCLHSVFIAEYAGKCLFRCF